MLAFVDESGDTGLKLGQGSSELFVIAMVVFEDHDEATAADQRITLLRRELALPESCEFHFTNCSIARREAFFKALATFEFFYLGFGLQKSKVYGEGFKHKEPFYKWVCGTVFENSKPYLDDAIVKIDKCGDRDFRNQLSAYLKKRVNDPNAATKRIRKVKAEDSKSNNLLQLADMVCGAITRSYAEGKQDQELYRGIIKHREISVRLWPP
jgi:hypothetical protein